MAWAVNFIVRCIRTAQRMYARKWSFLVLTVAIFGAFAVLLGQYDLLPNAPQAAPVVTLETTPHAVQSPVAVTPVTVPTEQMPVHVAAPSIGLSAEVSDPTTTNVAALDTLLLSGAVHYPLSAKLGEQGNVILFGHSSYLPILYDGAYKTFDGIQNLKNGAQILVSSNTTTYVYAVDAVQKENISTGGIPLDVQGKLLTLVTCNSFATKSDRFVVTAHLVDSYPVKK